MKAQLTDKDYQEAATILGCEVAAIKAVAEVESSGSGFLSTGEPRILFEGHVFWNELLKRKINPAPLAKANYTILYPSWRKDFYKGGVAEHKRLQQAVAINRDAALSSASWGKFQIMGFNFKAAGYKSLQAFISANYNSERDHLLAFCNIVKSMGLADELRDRRWADFARVYNGPGYLKNNYHTKMAAAYAKYSK